MANTRLLADLERALDLLEQVDETKLEFAPDPEVSPDVHALTGVSRYPLESHAENVKARISAVMRAGDALQPRGPSGYIAKLIVVCARLAPPNEN